MIHTYGGQVDELGQPLSAWKARMYAYHAYQKKYGKPAGRWGVAPSTNKGKSVSIAMFRALLKQAKTEYSTVWLDIMNRELPTDAIETGEQRKAFKELMVEFENNIPY